VTDVPSVMVDEGYFDTTGIRIVEGRGFRATDTRDTPQVTIVNRRCVERYWPGQNVIGKRVNIRGAMPRTVEIVGVKDTTTTVVTFLMGFLILASQNRDSEAVQVKLDELLRVSPGAHNVLMNLEELEEHELERIRTVYVKLAEKARRGVEGGRSDEGVPEIGELVEKTKPVRKPR